MSAKAHGREHVGEHAFLTFQALPWSVPGTSYASASGPVKSWYELGAATI